MPEPDRALTARRPSGPALPLFAAGVVGSLPRPQWVRDLLKPETRARLGEAEHRRQLDVAVAFVVALQEGAGLDIITDGEWRRDSYIGVIADALDGFERGRRSAPGWLTVTRPLRRRPHGPGAAASEVRFLSAHTSRAVKVCLPSPYLLGRRLWDAELSSQAYPTREAFMEALVPFLREELLAARDAGATIVQFDDTHLCQFVDPRERARFPDPEAEVQRCVALLNAVVEGVHGVTVAIHLCRGNRGRAGWGREGGYEPILPALKALDVQQYVLELAIPVAGDVAVLAELPPQRQVGVGCVDCRSEQVEPPEVIVARVERALAHLRPEQVLLNPDCGFAPGSEFDIPLDEAYLKLRHEVEAARRLRSRRPGATSR
ncbi:MAG TPA: cobalamin-independent methionine synthase II family protein [Chloroflexota bacterium]|jgi:5-methyltetrahydropteroyltriglutamate--homocysteine methyltransferase|nr:cobalamin-independent methionine synthase II family protein [Chloroflexota bacterium]